MDLRQDAKNLRHAASSVAEGGTTTMAPTAPSQVDSNNPPERARRSFVFADQTGLYISLVLLVALAAGAYSLRKYGVFGCQASGYGPDAYLSYCGATSYGDYDHGAIWFNLEPAATAAAANAQVLFIGNSRTQFGFSSKATVDWFSSISASYYLLGFSHYENYTFEGPLLRKLHPKAKVYVINIDSFFDQTETGPGKTVMRDEAARNRYEGKRQWQRLQQSICTSLKAICSDDEAIFRSRSTGAWTVIGNRFTSAPVSYDDSVDQNKVESYTALGKDYLPSLSPNRGCMILTIIPTVKTEIATAKSVAAGLGLNLVAPRLDGLMTFDHVHLDTDSAQRWSAAFLDDAGPQIRKCLNE